MKLKYLERDSRDNSSVQHHLHQGQTLLSNLSYTAVEKYMYIPIFSFPRRSIIRPSAASSLFLLFHFDALSLFRTATLFFHSPCFVFLPFLAFCALRGEELIGTEIYLLKWKIGF